MIQIPICRSEVWNWKVKIESWKLRYFLAKMIEIKTKLARFYLETILLLYDDFSFLHKKESWFYPFISNLSTKWTPQFSILNFQFSIIIGTINWNLQTPFHNSCLYYSRFFPISQLFFLLVGFNRKFTASIGIIRCSS